MPTAIMVMVIITAVAITRERERGTMEQLIVSPVRRVELVIGKIAPFIVIGYVQMTLILLAGRVVFGVDMKIVDEVGEPDEDGDIGATARSQADAPEIDGAVYLRNVPATLAPGDFVQVTVEDADAHDLYGVIAQ